MTASLAACPPREDYADPYQFQRKNLLSIERVRQLSALRPCRVVWDTIWCWCVIVAAWTVVARWTEWWTVLVAIPVIGSRYYAVYIIGHDGLHRRLFATRWLNDLFNDLFAIGPIGAITHINDKNHLAHHHYLATDHDPDRHKHGCFNKTRLHELFGYLTGISSVFRSVRNVFFSRPTGAAADSAASGSRTGYTLRDLAILLGWQVLLIGGLSWTIGWWAYPVLWLLPVYVFTFLADNFRSFAEHSYPAPDHLMDERRLVTFVSNPLERLFAAPMNMNYHAAHHLYPSIPYYCLPIADREIRRHPAAATLLWRGSYLGYLLSYALALPLEECRKQPVGVAGAGTVSRT
jgi:fatty acid desaturase